MTSHESKAPFAPKALALAERILDKAVDGIGPLASAHDLAEEYLEDTSYASNDERVKALIRWEATKNFTSGFVTGLGGVITLPVAVPAAIGATWILQARLCGAIARIHGHDAREDRVRTLILLAIIGEAGKEIVKAVGVKVSQRLTARVVESIPAKALIEINRLVGLRLLTKAGQSGAIRLARALPLVGGLVGGSFDASLCVGVGRTADAIFRPSKPISSRRPARSEPRQTRRRSSSPRSRRQTGSRKVKR